MSAPVRVKRLSQLTPGDRVRTPSGREAVVTGLLQARAQLRYCDNGEEVTLAPHLLALLESAKPKPFPARFFEEEVRREAKGPVKAALRFYQRASVFDELLGIGKRER